MKTVIWSAVVRLDQRRRQVVDLLEQDREVEHDVPRDHGAIVEETAIRVILVGAAIAAGTAIAAIIAANVGAIPSPG